MLKKLLIALFISSKAFAFEDSKYTYKLIDVEQFSLEQQKFIHNRDPYFPDKDNAWRYKTDLYWDVRVYRLFWDNDVHMATDGDQVRETGWKFTAGVHVVDYLDFTWNHHSRHSLEYISVDKKFPLADSYGFRINFIPKH